MRRLKKNVQYALIAGFLLYNACDLSMDPASGRAEQDPGGCNPPITTINDEDLPAGLILTGVGGGEADTLYRGTGFFRFPQFSVETNTIICGQGKNPYGTATILRMDSDGKNEITISTGEAIQFSPDGSCFIYVQESEGWDGTMFVVSWDGASKVEIGAGDAPVFQPDGSGLVYYKTEEYDSLSSRHYLYYYDFNQKSHRKISEGLNPLISPDGNKILFIGESWHWSDVELLEGWVSFGFYLCLSDPDGMYTDTLAHHAFLDNNRYCFLPDGSIIYQLEYDQPWQQTDIDFSYHTTCPFGSTYIKADFSPDGTKLVFEEQGVINMMNFDGSGLKILGQGTEPSFSSDGSQVIYAFENPNL